jgi:hypothetical protein
MRIIIGAVFVAVASGILAPTSQDLHKRYGEADSECLMARPGIGLTVEYGSDHSACRILIEPPHPRFHPEESPLMSSDTVTDILEEIAPVKMRGISIASIPPR